MDIKEFKQKLILSFIDKRLFYLPIKQQPTKIKKPLIYEFTINENNFYFQLYFSLNNFYNLNSYIKVDYSHLSRSTSNPYFNIQTDWNQAGRLYYVWQVYEISEDEEEILIDPNSPEYSDLFNDGVYQFNDLKLPKGLYNVPYTNDVVIDWGDGTIETKKDRIQLMTETRTLNNGKIIKILSFDQNKSQLSCGHEYKNAGTYKIKVYFNLGTINFSSSTAACVNQIKIIDWGDTGLFSLPTVLNAFSNSSSVYQKVISVPNITPNVVKNVISFAYLGQLLADCLNGDLSCCTYDMPILSSINYFFTQYIGQLKNLEFPDNSFCKSPNLLQAQMVFNNIPSDTQLIIGNNFCNNCKILYNVDSMFVFNAYNEINGGISIGDNFLRGCSRIVNAYLQLNYVKKIGINFMRDCEWLTCISFLSTVYYSITLQEGIFKGCPNIRSLRNCFNNINNSLILPNNFLSDLRTNTGRTKDIFYLPYFSSSLGTIKSKQIYDNIYVKFGDSMFSSDFLNNGRLMIGTAWSSVISYKDPNRLMSESKYIGAGIAPPIWEHLDTCSPDINYTENIEDIKTFSIYIANKTINSAQFGGAPSPVASQQWENINIIPGNYSRTNSYDDRLNFDNWFLYATTFSEFAYSVPDGFIFGENGSIIKTYIYIYSWNEDIEAYTRAINRNISFYIISEPIKYTYYLDYQGNTKQVPVFNTPNLLFSAVEEKNLIGIHINKGDIFTTSFDPMAGVYDSSLRQTKYFPFTHPKDKEIYNYRNGSGASYVHTGIYIIK